MYNNFEERYPQLTFLMEHAETFDTCSFSKQELQVGDLKDVQVIYLYRLSPAVKQLMSWLEEDTERDLVIIENDFGVLKAFLKTHEKYLLHPQIHLMMPFEAAVCDQNFCMDCASQFPVNQLAVLALEKDKDLTFEKFVLEIKRASTLSFARFCEDYRRDRILENLLPNFEHLKESFFAHDLKNAFKGKPAIVCGAGPSLKDHIDVLKKVGDQALILAGGSTIAALSNQGVTPHLGFAIDPNECEYPRLKASTAFTTPLLYGLRLHPSVFNTTVGELGYMQTYSSDPLECHMMEKLGIPFEPTGQEFGVEALSVTTIAIGFAHFMGCSPIILAGVDLAYTDLQTYAPGVFADTSISLLERKKDMRAGEQLIEKTNGAGDTIYTSIKWVMESASISKFAKSSGAKIYSASNKGLGFDGIETQPIENVLPKGNVKRFYIEEKIEKARSFDKKIIDETLQELCESIKRSKELCKEIVFELKRSEDPENALVSALEHDLQNERGFSLILQGSIPSLMFAIGRKNRGFETEQIFKRKYVLFEKLEQMCDAHLATFRRNGYSEENERSMALQNR